MLAQKFEEGWSEDADVESRASGANNGRGKNKGVQEPLHILDYDWIFMVT